MAADEASINLHDHGTALDEKKVRIQCNYCSKVVSGYFRLKCHLGGIRKDVTPCEKVPENVKQPLRNMLLLRKRKNLGREVGELYHPDLPFKRNLCPDSNTVKQSKCQATQTVGCGSGRDADTGFVLEDGVTESVSPFSGRVDSHTTANGGEKQDLLSRHAQKCIGRFFYENGIDFSAANSSSFKQMINATLGHGQMEYKIPSIQELKGWILQDEVKQMQEYVKNIRHSWGTTGCTILLDGWIAEKGHDLVSFIVDCPQGPVYLRSFDVSEIVNDVDALTLLVDGVIEEVGVENVVQIIACSASGWVANLGKQFIDKRRAIFWTVSASHCIELMLEKIGMMGSVREILAKAKKISRFIQGYEAVLTLFRNHSCGHALIKPSEMRYAMPYMTLENIVSEKKNLKDMFASSEWNTSIWASRMEGKTVADLVGDHSFWTGAEMVLKATIPLVRVLCLVNSADKPQVGYIYETMDQAKETIKEEFKNKKSHYMPFWKMIDEIWDTHLHSPLHAAGHYLNPSLFYSSDFQSDPEVSFGLLCCIVRMVKEQRTQDMISLQLDAYRHADGAFGEGSAVDQRAKISPAEWWSNYGMQFPELQKFAIRILSQTCDGASRYGLKRTLAERVLMNKTHVEHQQLNDLAFVHYNLQLQHFMSTLSDDIVAHENEIDLIDDWISDEAVEHVSQTGDSVSGLDNNAWTITGERPSGLEETRERGSS